MTQPTLREAIEAAFATAQKADAEKGLRSEKKLSDQLQESIEILEGQISVAVNWGFNDSDAAQASLAEMEKDKLGLESIRREVLKLEEEVAQHEAQQRREIQELRKNVITLCGSVRFRETFDRIAAELCFKGYIVLSLNVWGTEPTTGYIDDSNPAKRILESAHFRKIDLAEAILVINEGAYVGKSTAGEIAYAREQGKKVYWYNFVEAHYEQDKGKRPAFGESSWKDLEPKPSTAIREDEAK